MSASGAVRRGPVRGGPPARGTGLRWVSPARAGPWWTACAWDGCARGSARRGAARRGVSPARGQPGEGSARRGVSPAEVSPARGQPGEGSARRGGSPARGQPGEGSARRGVSPARGQPGGGQPGEGAARRGVSPAGVDAMGFGLAIGGRGYGRRAGAPTFGAVPVDGRRGWALALADVTCWRWGWRAGASNWWRWGSALAGESGLVDAAGEGPEVTVFELEANLRSGLLFGQTIPDDSLYICQGYVERRGLGLAGDELEAIV
jgi:hypothetical protein